MGNPSSQDMGGMCIGDSGGPGFKGIPTPCVPCILDRATAERSLDGGDDDVAAWRGLGGQLYPRRWPCETLDRAATSTTEMELTGLEPVTFALPARRSPN